MSSLTNPQLSFASDKAILGARRARANNGTEKLREMTLSKAQACARQRNGGAHGAPDYYERLAIEKMKIDDLTKGVVE